MVRIAVLLSLSAAVAAAFDSSTILNAKLNAGRGGFPCSVQGSVTMRLNPEEFYIQDATSGVRISSAAYELAAGDRLEIEGWMYLNDSGEFQLRATRVWHLGNGPPLYPRLITLSDAYSGGWQGQLVGVRGVVLNVDFGPRFDSISIRHERTSIRVFHAANHGGISVFERIYPGMQVAVAGISVPQTADPEFDGYQVRLRDPADLSIRPQLDGAATPGQQWAGGMAAVLFIGAAAWIWTSRQRRPSVQ